ncbi:hypothetical protein SAMN05661030_2846 [Klenkia taihuensis]|uniref:Uncharacterized protein n=1 Tax=Klenkia taihuensis TaxID=1225127 RepID=A0A1I1QLH3_9ACTN|nr:hypothetical protein SAMN05661030_2846 [Klenkia taihuensis]
MAGVLVVVVLAVIPFLASVVEAGAPGSIPQLAPPAGTASPGRTALVVVAVVRGVLLVLPAVLATRVWRGSGRRALVALLVLLAVLDLARGAVAAPVTVPVQLLVVVLLLTRSSRDWAPR